MGNLDKHLYSTIIITDNNLRHERIQKYTSFNNTWYIMQSLVQLPRIRYIFEMAIGYEIAIIRYEIFPILFSHNNLCTKATEF